MSFSMPYRHSITAKLGAFIAAQTAAQHLFLAYTQFRKAYNITNDNLFDFDRGSSEHYAYLDDMSFDASERASDALAFYVQEVRHQKAGAAEMAYIRSYRSHGCMGYCTACRALHREAQIAAGEAQA